MSIPKLSVDPGPLPWPTEWSPELLSMAQGPDYVKLFADIVVRKRNQLYWRMISNGKLSSLGWIIAERLEVDGRGMSYSCWPEYRPGAIPEERS
jgi:hypothetical protein